MQQRGGMVKDLRNNLHLLYDFYIVVKANSFSDAAKNNYVSQSNLSRNIKKLEEIMNLKLLNTSNKGFELTNDGLMLYNKLDIMFSNVNSEEMSDITLTIGTTRNIADILLSKYILKFKEKFPNVKLKIIIDNAESLDIFLSKHKIDILIDYLPHINYNNSSDLKTEKIASFEPSFACSINSINTEKIKTLKDLQNYKLILPGFSRRKQFLNDLLQSQNIELNPLIQLPDSKLMADLVKSEDYIGYFIKEEIKYYGLKEIKLREKMPENHIGIIYYKSYVNNVTKEFIKIVKDGEKNEY